MNNEGENPLQSETLSDPDNDAFELQEILIEGKRVMDEAEEISDLMATRIRANVPLPFKLKGLMGLTLGGMAGIWGVRSAWQAYRGGNSEQAAGVKIGRISKNALANQTTFLPKPASLVMDRIPASSSYFLNTTRLDHDSILENLLPQKLILDIHNVVPNERYYEKYIKPVFQAAISKATENPQNGLLDKLLFRSELIEYFRNLITILAEGTMINSPGLCNLKRYSISIYRLLIKEFNDTSRHYTIFTPHRVASNLSKAAIDASKIIDIDGICNELKAAVDHLIQEGSGAECSSDTEIILSYAQRASSEIALLDQSNPLEKLIFKNILNKLNHLNERFYRRAGARGSWGEFTFHSIQNSLTFGNLSSKEIELYTNLLIAHATIIPDLIGLRDRTAYNSTDVSILNTLLLDMQKQRRVKVVNFVQTSSIANPEVTEQVKIHPVDYKLPNITRAPLTTTRVPLTTKHAEQKATLIKDLQVDIISNASTTALPPIQVEGAELGLGLGVVTGAGVGAVAGKDIIAVAIAALGYQATFLATGLFSQIDKLRRLIANDPTRHIPVPPEKQLPKPPEQHMEDLNLPGPSSRLDFRFLRISDELNLRVSNSRSAFIDYVNGNFGHMDINRMAEYRNKYFRYKLDLYGIRFREGYSIWEGLELDSARDQFNIRSAKMTVAEHLDFVNAAITKTKKLFDIILDNAPENQSSSQMIMAYLVDYFKKTLNIQDDDIIMEVLLRLNEVASRSSNYLHTLARNRFKNIWFVSSYGDVERSVRQGDFITNLDSARIRSLPMFTTIYAGEVDDTIIAMFPEAAHPVNPEHPIPDFRYDSHHVGESLMHEITHASSTTEDYMYFERTLNGRAKNAKEMMEEFYKNLKNNVITDDLRNAINEYCRIYNKPIPTDLYAFFEENPRFKAYIIMNNAQSYETFFRDISEVFPYDIDSWNSILHSKVSDKNSLGQMAVLNGIGDKVPPII